MKQFEKSLRFLLYGHSLVVYTVQNEYRILLFDRYNLEFIKHYAIYSGSGVYGLLYDENLMNADDIQRHHDEVSNFLIENMSYDKVITECCAHKEWFKEPIKQSEKWSW